VKRRISAIFLPTVEISRYAQNDNGFDAETSSDFLIRAEKIKVFLNTARKIKWHISMTTWRAKLR